MNTVRLMPDWTVLGLSDNPFDPARELPEVEDYLLQDLVTQPLQVHIAPALKALYCPNLGKFADHLADFKNELRLKGYAQDPPSASRSSFIFAIRGPKGSGKTTLANMMIDWLKGCHRENETWNIEELFRDEPLSNPQEQMSAIKKLEEDIEKKAEKSHCLALDNLISGSEQTAYSVWDRLRKRRRIVMFLITDDWPVVHRGFGGSRFNVRSYLTTALSPEDAVLFVRHRMERYRNPEFVLPADNPIFPFDESNIRETVTPRGTNQELVTLRQFSIIVNEALKTHLLGCRDESSRGDTRFNDGLIELQKAVARMVA
jgi:hypothetical protein